MADDLCMILDNGRTGSKNHFYQALDDFGQDCQKNCLVKSLEELRRIAEDDIEKELKKSVPADQHHPFPPHWFEPYIPIKPHRWYWFMYDSSTILKHYHRLRPRVRLRAEARAYD